MERQLEGDRNDDDADMVNPFQGIVDSIKGNTDNIGHIIASMNSHARMFGRILTVIDRMSGRILTIIDRMQDQIRETALRLEDNTRALCNLIIARSRQSDHRSRQSDHRCRRSARAAT